MDGGAFHRSRSKPVFDETKLTDWELVRSDENSYVCVIKIEAVEMTEETAVDHGDLIGMCDPRVVDRNLLLSLIGSQETLRNVLWNFETVGVVSELHWLGGHDGDERTLETLTDRQLGMLQTACD